ncbi:hypothetical protein [Burkholderia latens]|uniref:Uncharacterized protein n=1 Tax=Burkholderia latens TaxID=488446 RepID=A0A6H9STZ7_9BURK|nr:hypothetical protein [Burkholderia latens]KAB0644779.1 hypothetical protein F7R21_00170 [Burkholderia latens]
MTFILPHNPADSRRQRAQVLFLEVTADEEFMRESLRIVEDAQVRIRAGRVAMRNAELLGSAANVVGK